MLNLKNNNNINKLIYKTETDSHRHREQTCGCQGGVGEGRDGLGVWVSRCKLLHIEWINNKVLLYSTGNYIQHLVITCNGKESEK